MLTVLGRRSLELCPEWKQCHVAHQLRWVKKLGMICLQQMKKRHITNDYIHIDSQDSLVHRTAANYSWIWVHPWRTGIWPSTPISAKCFNTGPVYEGLQQVPFGNLMQSYIGKSLEKRHCRWSMTCVVMEVSAIILQPYPTTSIPLLPEY